ncbi:hypothetical protein BVX97_00675 [bacterium E08(2017)]|nr:hypothetical protein BVX97_00675 [bacterium E08(2017)]
MNTTRIILTVTFAVLLASCVGHAADTDVIAPELLGTDSENAAFAYSPEGYVTVMFGPRYYFPKYAAATLLADSSVASGVFTGDYAANGIHKLGFRIRCEADVEVAVAASVILQSASGRSWRNKNVQVSIENGAWVANNIEFTLEAGWTRDGGGDLAAMWAQDIKNVQNIGIRLTQMGNLAQTYSVDTFVLLDSSGSVVGEAGLMPARIMNYFTRVYGISDPSKITDEMKNKDSDSDGMSDWNELMAGTDPESGNSVFAAEITEFADDGITISWPCVLGGEYELLKRDGFDSEFVVIQVGLMPNATHLANGKMEFKDSFTVDKGPYLYKVILK